MIDHEPKNTVDEIFTWGTNKFFWWMCQDESHWSVKIVDYLWVDCACCLFYRGVTIGALLAGILGLIVGAVVF